jgi:hypothetical protein
MATDGQNTPQEIPLDVPAGQPGPTGKTKDEWWAYTLRKLGGGIIDIELTNEQKTDCIDDTDRWFAERVGFIQYSQLPLAPGQSNYYLSSDIIEVYDLWLPSAQLPTLGADEFSYSYFGSLFGASWASPQQAPMPYSDLVQRLQYLETIGRIFTTDRDFDWQPELRRLVIMPPPHAGSVGALVANAIIKAGSARIVTEQLDPRPSDFYRRKLLIEAMRTLGQIRDTYDAYPTVGGERTMNGGALIQRADQLEGKLEQDVINHERSCPIISG